MGEYAFDFVAVESDCATDSCRSERAKEERSETPASVKGVVRKPACVVPERDQTCTLVHL